MAKKEILPKHVVDKDKGDEIATSIGHLVQETRNSLLNMSFEKLLTNLSDEKAWYKTQISSMRAFRIKVDKYATEEKKKLLKAAKQGTNELKLTKSQSKQVEKVINKGIDGLASNVVKNHLANVISIGSSLPKNNVTQELYNQIREKMEQTQKYGIVAYKNGRKVRWENYMEMKVRTDIQNDISKNMLKTGSESGVIFYLASYFGDCAKDHVEAQGKIYVDKNWRNIVSKDRITEIENYIHSKGIQFYQDIIGAPTFLTTRPNCRHYFQMISIDEVLGIKNNKALDNKREEFNLNFNGKYHPEKYKALSNQRYNERTIRKWKGVLETDQKLLDNMPKDVSDNQRLLLSSKIALDKRKIRDWQAKQRILIKQNASVLKRNYAREEPGKMISDFGIGKELKKEMPRKYLFEKIKINTDINNFTNVKRPSENYSWEISKNGKIHAIESHPELATFVPNYLEKTIEAIKKPDKMELDKKYINTTTFIKNLDEDHILRVSVLIGEEENKVKSVRYQSIKKKKSK